jgi:hypothetical protein
MTEQVSIIFAEKNYVDIEKTVQEIITKLNASQEV